MSSVACWASFSSFQLTHLRNFVNAYFLESDKRRVFTKIYRQEFSDPLLADEVVAEVPEEVLFFGREGSRGRVPNDFLVEHQLQTSTRMNTHKKERERVR